MKIINNNYKETPAIPEFPKTIRCEHCQSILEIVETDVDEDGDVKCPCCPYYTKINDECVIK